MAFRRAAYCGVKSMAEPKIIFCPKNHIYDASLHSDCPYCRKIAEEQNELAKTIGDIQVNDNLKQEDDNDSETELLYTDADIEEDRTELLFPDSDNQEDYTELIQYDKNDVENEDAKDSKRKENKRDLLSEKNILNNVSGPVYGWLVCVTGNAAGRSFEISKETNYIISEPTGYYITDKQREGARELARIVYRDRSFWVEAKEDVCCKINGGLQRIEELKTYDLIYLDGMEFIFVELVTVFVNWGD